MRGFLGFDPFEGTERRTTIRATKPTKRFLGFDPFEGTESSLVC